MTVLSDILIIDVETTGLDPSKHACIELGAVLLDRSLSPVAEFSSSIAPWEGAAISPEALAVHKISLEEMKNSPRLGDAVERFNQTFQPETRKLLLSGWNPAFDDAFLRDLYRRANRPWPFGYRLLDVQSVVTFHSQLAPKSQRDTIKMFLNEEQTHRAFSDARQTAKLLKLFAERFTSAAPA